jgi:hypothetical protein
MVVNRLRSLWGPDAHEFNPERWLDSGAGIPAAGKQIQGHKHLLTFIDGPRKHVQSRSLCSCLTNAHSSAVLAKALLSQRRRYVTAKRQQLACVYIVIIGYPRRADPQLRV